MKDNPKNKDKILYVILAITVIIIIAVCSVIIMNNQNKTEDEKDLAYTELIKLIDEGKVDKIEMTVGSTSVKVIMDGQTEEDAKTSIVPSTQAFIELIQEKVQQGNNIELIQNPVNAFVKIGEILLNLFPTLIILVLFILLIIIVGAYI